MTKNISFVTIWTISAMSTTCMWILCNMV